MIIPQSWHFIFFSLVTQRKNGPRILSSLPTSVTVSSFAFVSLLSGKKYTFVRKWIMTFFYSTKLTKPVDKLQFCFQDRFRPEIVFPFTFWQPIRAFSFGLLWYIGVCLDFWGTPAESFQINIVNNCRIFQKTPTCSNLIFTVKSPARRFSRISLSTCDAKEKPWTWRSTSTHFINVGLSVSHMSMAQQTRMRKWKRSWSENRVSQMRMTSGKRNSCDNNRVSQRKVKYWGLIFCSSYVQGKRRNTSLMTKIIGFSFPSYYPSRLAVRGLPVDCDGTYRALVI